jgi:hypothetical protein
MSTKLTYPKLPYDSSNPLGYRWNLKAKIYFKIGKWLGLWDNSQQTHVESSEDLSAQEITDVDTIMASPSSACSPIEFALSGNRIIVKDIWEWRDQIEADAGFNVAITYRSSGNKGDALDEIVLQATDPTYQAEKILSSPEKNNFVGAVEGLIRSE